MDAILVCIGLFVNIYFLTDLNVQTPERAFIEGTL